MNCRVDRYLLAKVHSAQKQPIFFLALKSWQSRSSRKRLDDDISPFSRTAYFKPTYLVFSTSFSIHGFVFFWWCTKMKIQWACCLRRKLFTLKSTELANTPHIYQYSTSFFFNTTSFIFSIKFAHNWIFLQEDHTILKFLKCCFTFKSNWSTKIEIRQKVIQVKNNSLSKLIVLKNYSVEEIGCFIWRFWDCGWL